jgi:hypothetical protein
MRVSFVDVAYRGLRVAQKARWQEGDDGQGFLEHEAPLPVGSRLALTLESGAREALVVGVVEQEAGAKSPPGMRLRWADVPAQATPTADEGGEVAEAEADAGSAGIVVEETGDEVSGPQTKSARKKRRGRKTQNGKGS